MGQPVNSQVQLLLTLKSKTMRTKLLILGGVLAAGVSIHHSGHCPLMDAKKAIARHVHGAQASQAASAGSGTQMSPAASGTQAVAAATVGE
jgi:hypothetical protein